MTALRVLAIALCAICANAADFTGRWFGTTEGQPGIALEMRQNGNMLIGVAVFKGGGPVEFTGTVHANKGQFEIVGLGERASLSLTLDGDRISASVVEGSRRPVPFTLERIAPPTKPAGLEGRWTGTVTENGKSSEPGSLYIHQSGTRLVGIYECGGVEQAITGSIDNDRVKFEVENLTGSLVWSGDNISGSGGRGGDNPQFAIKFTRSRAKTSSGLSGRWAGVTTPVGDSEEQGKPFLLNLEQNGPEISGTFRSSPEPAKLLSPALRGNKLTFDVIPTGDMAGRKVHFDLNLVNDYQLEGEGTEFQDGALRTRVRISVMKRMD